MSVFFSIVGVLIVLAVSIGLAASAIGWTIERWRAMMQDRDHIVRADAKREVGRLMLCSSWWFTEDNGAWKAVQGIGNNLAMTGNFDVSECRDVWRREMQEIQDKQMKEVAA